ncbi:MAG: GTPase Era [Elusimicrobiota bacterium]
MENSPFRSGFAAILGRPNAGKSTLMNAVLGTKLSIVSSKPQTTRDKILGILNGPYYQIAFLDTPGLISSPKDPLQRTLRQRAEIAAREDADAAVLLVDSTPPSAGILEDLERIRRPNIPLILALNKIDLNPPVEIQDVALAAYKNALHPLISMRISARTGEGIADLIKEIILLMPESPPLYGKDQLSDRWERFFAAEIIREQVFLLFGDEIPHAIAVVIDEFKEKPKQPDRIRALLFVERESQKGIVIGKKGAALRNLEARSRQAVEKFLGRPAELELWVKVRKNWRTDPRALREFGY